VRLPGGLTARAVPDCRTVEIKDAVGSPLVVLTIAVPGEPVMDGEDLLLEADGVRSRLRVESDGAALTIAVTVDNLQAEPVELRYLGVGVSLGDGYAGWSWTSDLAGVIAVVSATDAGGGVLIRLRRGFLREVGELPVFTDEPRPGALTSTREDLPGRGAFHLSRPGAILGGHRRHAVALEVTALDDLGAVSAALPSWLPDVIVSAGTSVDLSLPDHAVVPGDGVDCTLVDTDVSLTGLPGHRMVAIQGRGVERLRLTWFPHVSDLLPPLVDAVTRRRPARVSDAAGFLVVDAVARGLAPDRERALDWLERVDWLDRDSLLADATAGLLAVLLAERRQLDEVWRMLGRRKVTAGYGLVVMRLWLATLAATGEVPPTALELLSRRAPDAASGLELALLSYRSPETLDASLTGLIHLLGGSLPGRPIGVSASRAAIAVSLLKLCPEGWSLSSQAAAAASKAEGLLLADFTPPPPDEAALHTDLDGLAWLLLGDLGV
jgi:hypothetical protein